MNELDPDPLTQVFGAHWTLLENNQMFCGLILPGNRIKYHTDVRSPQKKEGLTADLPEVRIVPWGGVANLTVSSSHTKFTKRFQIQISTGSLRIQEYLCPVELAVTAALIHWPEILLPLTWKGHQFATVLRMGDTPEGRKDTDLAAGIQGWAVMINTSVDLHILNTDLLGVL